MSLAGLLAPSRADACTCVTGIPLCESVWMNDVAFSGEVLSVGRISNPTGELSGSVRVRFRVFESWRSKVPDEVEVKTGLGGGDCGYTFMKGMTYLVYADSRTGGLRTSICSRTRPLSQAAEDIAYLKGTAATSSEAGRIFGTVQYERRWDPKGGTTPERLIAAYPVTLSDGKQTWKAVTDSSGRYEFIVPAGTYTITLTTPETERGHGPRSVTLADPRGCAAANFYVSQLRAPR